jgi:hypothetical protein
VPQRVRYGTTCLLIMELCVCVLFESNREGYDYIWDPPGPRGSREGETLAECKTDPKKPLEMTCSDLLASNQMKCDCSGAAWEH